MSGKSGMSGAPPATARHINAFPRPTWLSLCRAHVGHVGRARLHGASCGTDGRARDGCGPRGRHGETHAAPGGLSLGGGLSGRPARPVASMRGKCGGMGQVGASILNRHTFEVARHDVGQVGHVGHPTSTSKVYQRFSLPDMAFSMSGACRACRARPTSWGIMRDGWKAWAGCGPWVAWGGARRAGRLLSLGGRLFRAFCPACGLHAGQVRRHRIIARGQGQET